MIKKKDSVNIIKIKGYSYKINKLNQVTRFYIIMEKYRASLQKAMDIKPTIFN